MSFSKVLLSGLCVGVNLKPISNTPITSLEKVLLDKLIILRSLFTVHNFFSGISELCSSTKKNFCDCCCLFGCCCCCCNCHRCEHHVACCQWDYNFGLWWVLPFVGLSYLWFWFQFLRCRWFFCVWLLVLCLADSLFFSMDTSAYVLSLPCWYLDLWFNDLFWAGFSFLSNSTVL